jgi:hypothetical protein
LPKRTNGTKNEKNKEGLNFKQLKTKIKPKRTFIIEIGSDLNNFLQDSYEQFSTYEDQSSLLNLSENRSINSTVSPKPNQNLSMD